MTIFLGLTGSIGMGKSTTAQMFRDAGIPVHDSDAVVHALYAGRAAPLIEVAFPGTTDENGVNRTVLGQQVIGDDVAMKKLEALVHPLVREEELAFRQRVVDSGAELAILDVPLLFETGGDQRVDGIIVVSAPADVQRERVLAREGMTPEKFEAILSRQVPDQEKQHRADFIIDTSKGLDEAREMVNDLIKTITIGNWVSEKPDSKYDA